MSYICVYSIMYVFYSFFLFLKERIKYYISLYNNTLCPVGHRVLYSMIFICGCVLSRYSLFNFKNNKISLR